MSYVYLWFEPAATFKARVMLAGSRDYSSWICFWKCLYLSQNNWISCIKYWMCS